MSKIPKPTDPAPNIHEVPITSWRHWSEDARRMFNYVLAQGIHNKAVVSDLFAQNQTDQESAQVAAWNLAFVAAEFYDRLQVG